MRIAAQIDLILEIGTMNKEKRKNCEQCTEIGKDFCDGKICTQTGQLLFLMVRCPMEARGPSIDLDPAFHWFPNGGYANTYCNHCGKDTGPCHFCFGATCDSPYGRYPIKELTHCPLPRFDSQGHRMQPRDKHPLMRD